MKISTIREKHLLKQIQNLPSDLIFHIYEYMTGKAKFICNKKYEYLERNVKDDCKKNYVFWKSIHNVFEPLPKEKVITYLRTIIPQHHHAVIDRIWYHSKEYDHYYTGEDSLDLWEKDAADVVYYGNSRKAFDNHMTKRVIDAIYYYILQNITNFATKKKIHLTHPLYADPEWLDSSEVFRKMDSIHRLCKSMELLSENVLFIE